MIAIDISRIVHLDVEGLERYPPTKYGEFELPTNMVAVLNEVQFEGTVRQRLNSFIDLHRDAFRRSFSPGVGGFMLCYSIPAVDLHGTGQRRVDGQMSWRRMMWRWLRSGTKLLRQLRSFLSLRAQMF